MFELRKTSSFFIVGLSVWLMISAFAWPHTTAHLLNALLVGGVLGTIGLAAGVGYRGAFVACAALAVWLFLSLWVLPGRTPGLVANNMLVAVLAFGFACGPLASRRGLAA